MRDEDDLLIDRMVPFNDMLAMEGIGKTTGHHRVATGEYEAFRDGTKKLLISMRSILERRKRHLQKAEFGTRKGIKGFPRGWGKQVTA